MSGSSGGSVLDELIDGVLALAHLVVVLVAIAAGVLWLFGPSHRHMRRAPVSAPVHE